MDAEPRYMNWEFKHNLWPNWDVDNEQWCVPAENEDSRKQFKSFHTCGHGKRLDIKGNPHSSYQYGVIQLRTPLSAEAVIKLLNEQPTHLYPLSCRLETAVEFAQAGWCCRKIL